MFAGVVGVVGACDRGIVRVVSRRYRRVDIVVFEGRRSQGS